MTQRRDGWVSSGSCDINSIQYRLFAFESPIQEFVSARDEALGCIFEFPYGGNCSKLDFSTTASAIT
jgi:hypothetical protein